MSSKVRKIETWELDAMHTGTLMKRRRALLACEECLGDSDKDNNHQTEVGYIEFKQTSDWIEAYRDLKRVLSGREHYPSKKERKQSRKNSS